MSIENLKIEAEKFLSLKNYNLSSAKYSEALELCRDTHGEMSLESANLLLDYGQCLYLLAISQSDVIGKSNNADDQPPSNNDDIPSSSDNKNKSNLIQLSDEEEEEDDDDDGNENEDENEDDVEDDFGNAWEVTDLAKVIFSKQDDFDSKFKLADCHLLLGDIALELETFEEASNEYKSAIDIKSSILNSHSRQLAEGHFKLAISLELQPDNVKRPDALNHVTLAKSVLLGRLEDLNKRIDSNKETKISNDENQHPILFKENVETLSIDDAKKEVKDINELIEDLNLKVEELEQPPPTSEDPSKSTVDNLVSQLDQNKNYNTDNDKVNILQPKKKQDQKRKLSESNTNQSSNVDEKKSKIEN